MLNFFGLLLAAVAWCLLVPVAVLFVEVLFSLVGGLDPPAQRMRRPLAILMPAHNESATINRTLHSLVGQLEVSDRLIVVADNCTDDTAALASAQGAEVIVRDDLTRRGKGYALDFGVTHLSHNPPEIVVVIDADCDVAPGAIERLASRCAQTGRPVQALYLMHAGADAGLKMRIAEFAWIVKNQVRPMGLRRLGLPCQLMGTGMAFPWLQLRGARLASGHIVEDLKLGLDLARAGTPALFCADAEVSSNFPNSTQGVQSQRTRWEHGHLSVIVGEAPRLLLESLLKLKPALLALGLDLCVPPLALLALLVSAAWFAGVLFFVFTRQPFLLALTSGVAALFGFAVLASWIRYGRHVLSLGSLAIAVVYALAKIPLYLRFLVARQLHWVRSKRDSE